VRKIPAAHIALLVGVLAIFAWSAWRPHDRLTWWLETLPTLVGVIVLLATYSRFRFTTLCYVLIALHMALLCVGGHHTYAREPFFEWLRPIFGWERNQFDRLGHFAQGFVPAMIARELFVRLRIVERRGWMNFFIVTVCVTISAFYELLEWCAAAVSGSAATAFLATQGDVWDTQKDMLLAFIGAICALLFLSRWHDRALLKVRS
jgi:putative membrane protein